MTYRASVNQQELLDLFPKRTISRERLIEWENGNKEKGKRLSPEDCFGKIWDGKMGIICNQYNLCFAHETVDRFYCITDPMIIDGIVHILTIFVSNEYARVF
jgi:hypothetical protein